jgi:ABC-type multidrug transport system ATPase subunit
MSTPVVVTRGLTKVYGRLRALDGLELSIPAGSIFGLLGPNGAGKTTTFSLLTGLSLPTAGEATVLGQPLGRLHRLRGRLAALPQDTRFPPARSIRDTLALLARLGGVAEPKVEPEVDRVLAAVALTDAADTKGRALSHGMAKRAGLAQAFLGAPELVFLDEPTEGLDPRNAEEVRGYVRRLAGSATVVISSHHLAEVESLCDAAAILDHGKLVTQGTMAELTRADERVVVALGAGAADPTPLLAGLACVRQVAFSAERHEVAITLHLGPGDTADQAVSAVLQALLKGGLTVGAVTRGERLQARFLEVTK